MRSLLLALLAAVLMSACAELPTSPAGGRVATSSPAEESASVHEAARADEEVRLVIDIMRFVQQTAALPANDQRKALDAVLAAHRKDASRVGTRLRLATLLALPQKPFSDPARAAALLEPIATGPDGALQRLASLLLGQVNDRLRERRRADQLNVQLEQLRAIERGLIERTR